MSTSICIANSTAVRAQDAPDEVSTAVWEEAFAWLAFLPTLFITARGAIEADSTPYALQFTAMAADPLWHRISTLVCALIIVFLISTRFRRVLAVCRRSKLLLLLPAIALLSVFWSQLPKHTLLEAMNLVSTTLFAVYLYVRYPKDRLVSFLIFAAFISLLLCVLSVTAFPTIGIDPRQDDAWRGIFGQRNNCSIACALFLVLGMHARARGLAEQLMRGAVIFLSLLFIVMSGSRQGWIIAAFILLLTLALRLVARIRSLDRILILLFIGTLSAFFGFLIFANSTHILAILNKDPTMSQRTIIWSEALLSIAKRPLLGYGYSAYWTGLSGPSLQTVLTTGWMESQAQDGYLDVLLQFGLAGFIPLCFVFLRGIGQSYAALERSWSDRSAQLAIALLPVILIENIGESSLLYSVGIPWFYALIAFLVLGRPDGCAEEF